MLYSDKLKRGFAKIAEKELSNANKTKQTGKNDDLEFLKFCTQQIAKSQNIEIDFNTKQILIKSPSC